MDMQELEKYLEGLILENIVIKTDDKVLKRGKLKIFSTKQFYLRLTLQTPTSDKDKLYEIPYPFKIKHNDRRGLTLDYKLSSFCSTTDENYSKIKSIRYDLSPISRIYDKFMYILPSSEE